MPYHNAYDTDALPRMNLTDLHPVQDPFTDTFLGADFLALKISVYAVAVFLTIFILASYLVSVRDAENRRSIAKNRLVEPINREKTSL